MECGVSSDQVRIIHFPAFVGFLAWTQAGFTEQALQKLLLSGEPPAVSQWTFNDKVSLSSLGEERPVFYSLH